MIAFDFGVHDSKAKIVEDAKGIVYDDDTKDTETIQVTSKMSKEVTEALSANSQNIQETNLLYGENWETEMVRRYMETEVLPYAENTYKVDDVAYGARWSFNKQFYTYVKLPESKMLLKEYEAYEKDMLEDLKEIFKEG